MELRDAGSRPAHTADHDAAIREAEELALDQTAVIAEVEVPSTPAYDWGGLTFPTTRYSVITGPAGSGKTTFVRDQMETDGSHRLCATNGIAAVNLGDAVTINSLLRYFDTRDLQRHAESGFLAIQLGRLRRAGITRLILDEMSMMEARQLDLLVGAMEEVNCESAVQLGHEPALGLTLVGDFLQLPPVEGLFAFQAECWPLHFQPNTVKLTTIHRQADPVFLSGLRALRVGQGKEAQEVFGSRMHPTFDREFQGTTILARNAEVDAFNKVRHDTLPGEPVIFDRHHTGVLHQDWRQIPETVGLKPGALVMILANRSVQEWVIYANGDLGEFLGTVPGMPHTAQVRLQRTGRVVNVPYHTKENTQLTGDPPPAPKEKVVGELSYMPLRLAYATTVHKSQGLTLDTVQVNITDRFWASPAMLYVGLSRVRSLEGLRLIGFPNMIGTRAAASRVALGWWN